jgi:hypothetical protein
MSFPLEQWFDLSKRIDKIDVELSIAEIMLRAVKQQLDPEGSEVQKTIRAMKRAVKEHNKKLNQ